MLLYNCPLSGCIDVGALVSCVFLFVADRDSVSFNFFLLPPMEVTLKLIICQGHTRSPRVIARCISFIIGELRVQSYTR